MEVLPHNKYAVMVDGSGNITRRNRRFLRLYLPAMIDMPLKETYPVGYRKVQETLPQYHSEQQGRATAPLDHPSCVTETPSSNHDVGTPSEDSETVVPPIEHSPDQSLVETPGQARSAPHTLRCLRDYNAPGLKESGPSTSGTEPENGGPRRSKRIASRF